MIALVGGETLLGRDIVEVFGESSLGQQLKLVASDEEETGKLTELSGAPAFLAKLDPLEIDDADIIILAGSKKSSEAALKDKPKGLVIDLTGFTEDETDAQLRSPLVEGESYRADLTGPQIVAHPAATAIALVLKRIHATHPIARAIVHVFEPASERGKAGIDELQQQTVNLFAFQPLPKKIFDTQASFNMLPAWGEEAAGSLLEIEERIERHLASLLDRTDGTPMPSLRLLHAPVFHAYTFSFWVDFEESITLEEVEETLAGDLIEIRSADVEPAGNVGVAGQPGLTAGPITPDRNSANALWIWVAADNLRLAAESAALIAREAA